jgi:tRNA/tmRNA/rRNA uracil-C5-methylase (TrmA/RlmC/RlmD family)
MDISVDVEEVSPELHWRTRAGLTASANGKLGFFANRSHQVIEIADCLTVASEMNIKELSGKLWQANTAVEVALGSDGAVTVATAPKSEKPIPATLKSGSEFLTQQVEGRVFQVHHNSFWQGNSVASLVLSKVSQRIRRG